MQTSTLKNPDGSITHVTRNQNSGEMEFRIADSRGGFISKTIYLYDSKDRLQEYTRYDEQNVILKRVTISYGPGPWDGQNKEFDSEGHLLKRTDCGWDSENKCKVQLFYDSVGNYLGKAFEKLDEDGKFIGPKYFDKDGNRMDSEP